MKKASIYDIRANTESMISSRIVHKGVTSILPLTFNPANTEEPNESGSDCGGIKTE